MNRYIAIHSGPLNYLFCLFYRINMLIINNSRTTQQKKAGD